MTTVYPPHIHQDLSGQYIFLDTSVFIYASKNKTFFDFLADLKSKAGCSFVTIPSVVFEFTRGSKTVSKYNQRLKFLNDLVDHINPVNFLNKISDFSVVMSKINDQNKAYTDFLLAACLYNFRHIAVTLLTSDLKAFSAFFSRTHILAVEHGREIKNFGFYKLNIDGYANAASNVLSAD